MPGSLETPQQHHPGHRLQGLCPEKRSPAADSRDDARRVWATGRLCAQQGEGKQEEALRGEGEPLVQLVPARGLLSQALLSTGRTPPSFLSSLTPSSLNRDSQTLTAVCKNHQESLLRIS